MKINLDIHNIKNPEEVIIKWIIRQEQTGMYLKNNISHTAQNFLFTNQLEENKNLNIMYGKQKNETYLFNHSTKKLNIMIA